MSTKPNPMKDAVMGMSQIDEAAPAEAKTKPKIISVERKEKLKSDSSKGRRHIGAYVDFEMFRDIKILGAELDRSNQDLFEEALMDLFLKYENS